MTDNDNKGLTIEPNETDVVTRETLEITSKTVLTPFDKWKTKRAISGSMRDNISDAATEIIRMHRDAVVTEYESKMKLRGIQHYKWFQDNVKGIVRVVQDDLVDEEKELLKSLRSSVKDIYETEEEYLVDADASKISARRKDQLKDLITSTTDNAVDRIKERMRAYLESYNKSFVQIFMEKYNTHKL